MNQDFGYKHLSGLVWIMALIALLLIVLLVIKRKYKLGENFDRAVIRYTCYIMWAGEIIKTFRMVNYGDYGPVGYYPLWMAPFHICSMALYAYLIVGSKRRRPIIEEWVMPFAYAVMLIVTSIILVIPASSGILGIPEDWSFCFDNLLPYQAWLYHGCLFFASLYMALSGFYKPRWSHIYKATAVIFITAAGAQALNYGFDGSGADFMTLRYGNGNPFAFLLEDTPILYYLLLASILIAATALVIAATMGIRALVEKRSAKNNLPE